MGLGRLGGSSIGWLRSKSRGFGWIQDRNCPAKRRLSRTILQETLSLPVLQRCSAGMDKLRIHQRRSGKKVLCFAEKRTRYSPATETFRFLAEAARVGWVEPFAKPISAVCSMMGIASLHPSYAPSYPAHAGYPVRRGFSIPSQPSLEYWIARSSRATTAVRVARSFDPGRHCEGESDEAIHAVIRSSDSRRAPPCPTFPSRA